MLETRLAPMAAMTTPSTRKIEGVAVPYKSMSCLMHDRRRAYREKVKPGALQWGDDTVLLCQHDQSGVPLARVSSGTLRFTESEKGLMFEADLPENRADVLEALERGDLDGACSIGFVCEEDTWMHSSKGSIRTVQKANLIELSLVTAGAYPAARGSLKESY